MKHWRITRCRLSGGPHVLPSSPSFFDEFLFRVMTSGEEPDVRLPSLPFPSKLDLKRFLAGALGNIKR